MKKPYLDLQQRQLILNDTLFGAFLNLHIAFKKFAKQIIMQKNIAASFLFAV